MDYIKKNAYLKQVMRNIRLALDKSRSQKKKANNKDAKKDENNVEKKQSINAKIIVANQYADWQKKVLEVISACTFNKLVVTEDWKAKIRGMTTGEIMKKSLQFGSWILVYIILKIFAYFFFYQ